MIAVGGEDGRVVIWHLSNLRTQNTIKPNSTIKTYVKKKERKFESFTPFHEMKNKKLYSTSQANVAVFGHEAVVRKAKKIFNEQVGGEEPERQIKFEDLNRRMNLKNINAF